MKKKLLIPFLLIIPFLLAVRYYRGSMTFDDSINVEHPIVSVSDWEGVIGGGNIGYIKTISNTTYVTGVVLILPGEDYPDNGTYELAWDHTNSTLVFGNGDAIIINSVDGTYSLDDGAGNYVSAVVDYSELPAGSDPNDSITIATATASNGFGKGTKIVSLNLMYDFGGYLWAGVEGEDFDGSPANAVNLYRSRDGLTWVRVIDGDWWGADTDQDHPDAMIKFNGYLYFNGGCSNGNEGGVQLWRSRDGLLWENTVSDGWGDPNNENAYEVTIFDGYLYYATYNTSTGVQVWRSNNGTDWEQSGTNGLGYNSQINRSTFLIEYNGCLYGGRRNNVTNKGMIFRSCDGINWSMIKEFDNTQYIYKMVVFRNELYGLLGDTDITNWQIVKSSDGINWNTICYDTGILRSGDGDKVVWNNPVAYNNELYFCAASGEIVRSKDGAIWSQINITDFGDSGNYILWKLWSLRGYLYAGIINNDAGCEMWRMNTGRVVSNSGSAYFQDLQVGPSTMANGYLEGIFGLDVDDYINARYLGVNRKAHVGNLVIDSGYDPNITSIALNSASGQKVDVLFFVDSNSRSLLTIDSDGDGTFSNAVEEKNFIFYGDITRNNTVYSDHSGDQSYRGEVKTYTVDSGQPYHVFGQPYYITADGELECASTQDPNNPNLCVVLGLGESTGSQLCLVRGYIWDSDWSWIVGGFIYLDDPNTPLTQTAPSCAQAVGYCDSDPNGFYFNPEFMAVKK